MCHETNGEAVGIDTAGQKRLLDFERCPSENTTVVSALIERLAGRGVKAGEGGGLLVQCDGCQGIDEATRRIWPEAIQREYLMHAHSNLRDRPRRRDRADLDIQFKNNGRRKGTKRERKTSRSCWIFISERNAAAALA